MDAWMRDGPTAGYFSRPDADAAHGRDTKMGHTAIGVGHVMRPVDRTAHTAYCTGAGPTISFNWNSQLSKSNFQPETFRKFTEPALVINGNALFRNYSKNILS